MGKKGKIIFWIVGTISLLCGCDPVTRYKITSTIFDGVPSMPPAEQYCREYHQRAVAEELEAEKKKQQITEEGVASTHPPYAEKRCNDCHDKSTESGFVAPARQLCSVCHPGFLKGAYAHGPAAVGDCVMCHSPHNSKYKKLLKQPKSTICGTCHQEKRMAQGLHNTAEAKGMACTDCHNPHAGNSRFFLE